MVTFEILRRYFSSSSLLHSDSAGNYLHVDLFVSDPGELSRLLASWTRVDMLLGATLWISQEENALLILTCDEIVLHLLATSDELGQALAAPLPPL